MVELDQYPIEKFGLFPLQCIGRIWPISKGKIGSNSNGRIGSMNGELGQLMVD